jgi:peptidyl-prolyl cis-trans isomerase SurA
MRSLSIAIAFFSALFAATTATSQEVIVDRIVAIVDGTPILRSDLMDKINKGPLVMVSEYPADESATAMERALQDSINFELVISKARELEIDVQDDEVDAEIKHFLDSKGLTTDDLQKHLSSQDTTIEDYKTDFKDQMIFRRFQGRVINPLVKITDKDIETFYLKRSGSTSDLVELVLRHILISVAPNASDSIQDAKRKLAAEVHQKLQDGMAFAEAAKIYSDEERARENGGLMNPIKMKDLAGAIRAEVETLDIGQFTAPVRTSLGFHIFFLEEKRFAGSQEFQAQKRQLEFELRTLELQAQTRRWLQEQRQRTKVEIIKE